jgi:hypothetical protein
LTTVGFSPEVKPVKDGIGSNLSLFTDAFESGKWT